MYHLANTKIKQIPVDMSIDATLTTTVCKRIHTTICVHLVRYESRWPVYIW